MWSKKHLVLVAVAGVLLASALAAPTISAQDTRQCFPETGKCVQGVFLAYWRTNGGLRQQGLPISDELQEQGADGVTRTVQYFERARFEHHPQNQAPNDVLLGLLGSEQFKARYQMPAIQDPVTIAGQDSKNTALFTLAGGTYLARWEARPTSGSSRVGCFHSARLVGETSGRGESVGSGMVDAGAVGHGETFLYKVTPGRYYLDASSGCQWSVTLTQQR